MSKVIIYTTPQCVYCRMAKEYFRNNNVSYEEKDVAVDEKARNDMIEKSGQFAVPVIDIDGKIIIGFDRPRLSQMLSIR